MRLCERTLAMAELAPRIRKMDGLGGAAERFSDERIAFRAARLPESGKISVEERGAADRNVLRLLAAADVQVRVGDGVQLDGRMYRISAIQRWTAHVELICEAV